MRKIGKTLKKLLEKSKNKKFVGKFPTSRLRTAKAFASGTLTRRSNPFQWKKKPRK